MSRNKRKFERRLFGFKIDEVDKYINLAKRYQDIKIDEVKLEVAKLEQENRNLIKELETISKETEFYIDSQKLMEETYKYSDEALCATSDEEDKFIYDNDLGTENNDTLDNCLKEVENIIIDKYNDTESEMNIEEVNDISIMENEEISIDEYTEVLNEEETIIKGISDYEVNNENEIDKYVIDEEEDINYDISNEYYMDNDKDLYTINEDDYNINSKEQKFEESVEKITETKHKITDTEHEIIDDDTGSMPDSKENIKGKYIIGKLAGEDLFDNNNNLIVSKDSVITTEILDKAEKSGRLINLIMSMQLPDKI